MDLFANMSPTEMVRVDHVLSLTGAAGEFLVLLFLLRSKTYQKLPLFTVYIAWTIVSDLSSIYFENTLDAKGYLRFYLTEVTLDSLLQFAFLVELAWSVLRPIQKSLPRYTLYVLIGLMAGAGLVIWPFAGMGVSKGFLPEEIMIQHSQQTFAVLRVVCFLVLASLSQLLSIGWRDRELQVATGLGFFSIVSLIVSVLHSHPLTYDQYHYLDWAMSASYLGSLSYWIFCFSTGEQKRREFSPQMLQFLLQMGGGARSSRIALTNLPQDRFQDKD